MNTIALATVDSPIGELTVAARGPRVCLVHFGPDSEQVRAALANWYPGAQLLQPTIPVASSASWPAISGDMTSLDEVEVELHGTDFQQRVWLALRTVAAGTTSSYAELAGRSVRQRPYVPWAPPTAPIPSPSSCPCHRIIGSNGSLTGYGGGLDRKRWLLNHEGVTRTLF